MTISPDRGVVGSREDISEESTLYQTAADALIGMRRTMLVISTILGLGAMHTYDWYLSWDNARIAAREGILARIADGASVRAEGGTDRGPDPEPGEIEALTRGLQKLRESQQMGVRAVPLIGIEVPEADYSVALLLLGTAMLVWVVLFQRKAFACLEEVETKIGWPVARALLRHNFVLISDSGSLLERWAGYLLFLGLALLASVCLASDITDLIRMSTDPLGALAFEAPKFTRLLWWRIGMDVVLLLALWALGLACLFQHRGMEKKVLRYARAAAKVEE